jgi:hypothetical protein
MRTRLVLVLVLVLGLVLVLAACESAHRAPPAQPTSAEVIAAGSPDLRTVDNSGFATPSGQTRQVTQGMGPSTLGRGMEVAPPQREEPEPPLPPEPRPPREPAAPAPAPVDATELTARIAQAACDRERQCERIGKGRTFESVEACMAALRARVTRGLSLHSPAAARECTEIRGDRMQLCLTAIHRDACSVPASFAQLPACTVQALCPE